MKNKSKDITTSKYLVAYLDFLGGVNLIKNDKNNVNLSKIKQIYTFVLDKAMEIEKKETIKKIKYKIFSDNVIIASKIEMKTGLQIKRSVINFFYLVALFQIYALEQNYLLRGGITVGDLYIDKDMVWGKALVRAYEQESKEAIYPRVIIDKSVEDDIFNKIYYDSVNFQKINCCHDDDTKLFLDYLSLTYSDSMKEFVKEWSSNHKNKILEYKNKSDVDSKKILEKLIWHKKYFNSFCDNKNLQKYKINGV